MTRIATKNNFKNNIFKNNEATGEGITLLNGNTFNKNPETNVTSFAFWDFYFKKVMK